MQRDVVNLNDMLQAAYRITEFIEGLDEAAFYKDELRQSAVQHKLTVIGEAANRISKAFQEQHPVIPWREIVGMRNILTHQYDHILIDRIWETATTSVPQLIQLIHPLIPPPKS